VLLSLGMLLSTRLSGITAGVIALVAWLMAWIAGVVGDIGTGLQNQAVENVGVVSHVLLPADGLWRGAIYAMEPDTLIAAMRALGTAGRANPFAAVDAPPTEFLAWVVVWFAIVLGASIWSFRTREIWLHGSGEPAPGPQDLRRVPDEVDGSEEDEVPGTDMQCRASLDTGVGRS